MSVHYLNKFKIQKYYQKKTNFSNFYSRKNIPKIKIETYVKKLFGKLYMQMRKKISQQIFIEYRQMIQ